MNLNNHLFSFEFKYKIHKDVHVMFSYIYLKIESLGSF